MAFVGNQKVTVVPRTTGSRDASGFYIAAEGTPVVIDATVNPIPGEELDRLPAGERQEINLRVITRYELNVPDATGAPGDLIIYEGEKYEVREAQRYRRVIPHVAARIRRLAREAQ